MKLLNAYREVARERYFRRYLFGEGISSLGDAMSDVTVVLLALSLARHDSALAVSLSTAAYLAPGILTGVLLGRHFGRVSPRALLLFDSVWRCCWLGLAAALAIFGGLELWSNVACLGLASLSRPANAAGARGLLPQLLGRAHLFSGNSLVQGTVQIATVLGPAAAGVFATTVGAGVALALDAASFFVMAIVAWSIPAKTSTVIPIPKQADQPERRHRLTDWFSSRQLRPVTILFLVTALTTVAYGPMVVGMPILISTRTGVLPAGSELGLLWSLFGVGMVVGGLVAGGMPTLATARRAALLSAGWGLTVIVVGLPVPVVVTGLAMLLGGLAYAPFSAIVYTVMQQTLPGDLLAEGAAYLHSVKSVSTPSGVLIAGVAIAAWSPATVIIAAGILLVAACLLVALRSSRHVPESESNDQQLA